MSRGKFLAPMHFAAVQLFFAPLMEAKRHVAITVDRIIHLYMRINCLYIVDANVLSFCWLMR